MHAGRQTFTRKIAWVLNAHAPGLKVCMYVCVRASCCCCLLSSHVVGGFHEVKQRPTRFVCVCVCVSLIGIFISEFQSVELSPRRVGSKYPPSFQYGVTIHGPSCEVFCSQRFFCRELSSGSSLSPGQLPTLVCLS